MTEKQKLLFEYGPQIKSAIRGLRTYCVNNGLSNKALSQSIAIEFYCNKKMIQHPSKEDEIGFLLEILFSSKCEYIKDGSIIKRVKNKNPLIQKKVKLTPEEFYNSSAWISLRNKVIKAYGRVCMKCKYSGPYIQVDHIKPRSLFPKLELKFYNMQVLCKDCNLEKSNKHFTDYRTQ